MKEINKTLRLAKALSTQISKVVHLLFRANDIKLLLFSSFFVLVVATLCPAYYETNDDIVMQFISNGFYSGTPDAHLVFINYIYGLPLTWLYNLTAGSGIEWYPILFLLWHIMSLYIISKFIVRSKFDTFTKTTFLLLLYFFELTLIIKLQFTTTSALLATAGLLLAYLRGGWKSIVGIILFLVASLIRFDAAMLVLLLLLPIAVYRFLTDRSMRLKLLVYCGICISTAFSFELCNKYIYNQDQDWAYYLEWNKVRGSINDNPNASKLVGRLPDGITEDDYHLLRMFIADPMALKLDQLNSISEKLENTTTIEKIVHTGWFINKYKIFIILLGIMFYLAIQPIRDKGLKFSILGYILFWCAISIFISMDAYVKQRVFLAMLGPAFMVLIIAIKERSLVRKGLICIFVIVLAANLCVTSINFRNSRIRVVKRELSESMGLLKRNEFQVIIPYKGDFMFELLNPFAPDFTNKFCGVGWMTNIPFNKDKFDSHLTLLDREKVMFLHNSSCDEIKSISVAIKKNYGIDTKIISIDSTENFKLLKWVAVNPKKPFHNEQL